MENDKKNQKTDFITAIGKRKEAVARVRLSPGNGQITVNGKPIAEYFVDSISQKIYSKPLEVTKTLDKYSISIKLEGGGRVAQLQAVVHGIARAIALAEPTLRIILKKEKMLTRDARVKERRKFGNAQKARAKKQSPKR